MRAKPDGFAVIQHKDLIRMLQRGGTLRHNENRGGGLKLPQCLTQCGVGRKIQSRSTVVQNEDLRFTHQCTRNRQPLPEEMQACLGHLRAQVALVRPRVFVLLGATAVSAVLGPQYRITRCHGQWFERKGVSILATYHPSALLRDESKKRDAWHDLQLVRQRLRELELYPDLLGEEEQ